MSEARIEVGERYGDRTVMEIIESVNVVEIGGEVEREYVVVHRPADFDGMLLGHMVHRQALDEFVEQYVEGADV